MGRAREAGAFIAAWVCCVAAFGSCTSDGRDAPGPAVHPGATAEALPPSVEAAARVATLREAFAVDGSPLIARTAGVAFEPGGADVKAVLAPGATRSAATKTASVALPLHAAGKVRVEDVGAHVGLSFALIGARDVPIAVAEAGVAVYAGAYHGADVIHRVHAEGVEDYVAFDARPAREELAYDVDVQSAAGLRFVGNSLELLDAGGAPRLRIAPPYVLDHDALRREATLSVEGCAFDADPRAPWGRAVTPPAAATCRVRVAWHTDAYPAIVDPGWTTTGSLATGRRYHTATTLGTGNVLVAGGYNGAYITSAELYNPAGSGSFASTGGLTAARGFHQAVLLGSGNVLVVGGYNGSVSLSTAELFTGAGFSQTGSSMGTARYQMTATLLSSGRVLVAGGYDRAAATYLSTAEIFDGTSTFAPTGSMSTPRASAAAALLGSGKVLVAGGTYNGTLSSAELFDPAGNGGVGSFTSTGPLTTARSGGVGVSLASGDALVVGGTGPTPYPTNAELFGQGTGTFGAGGALATGRQDLTAVRIPSGKVIVAGGYNGTTSSWPTATEIWDPSTKGFSSAGSLSAGRQSAAAAVLLSGRVLVPGGTDGTTFLASADIYASALAGQTCTTADDCGSGVCEDGVCCSGPCSGTCKTCTAGTGACVAVTGADDPDTCTGTSTCDATGACKKKQGQTCAQGTECASANCADSTCCDKPCSGACDRCNLASAAGTCTIVAAGDPGQPSCTPYACDGVNATCPASCTADSSCAAGEYCSANGQCVAQKAQGAACSATIDCKVAGCRECGSAGGCVDGVCCDSACAGACVSCTASGKGTGADGTCGSAAAGTNPRGACAADPGYPANCKSDGKCDGAGSCRAFAPAATACGATSCANGMVTGMLCNGSGACQSTNPQSCGNYVCAGTACGSTCSSDSDCATGAYCTAASTCAAKQSLGAACTSARQCASGSCADGVCCNVACQGQCQACNLAGSPGTCSPVTSGQPHGARPPCDGTGTCGGACDGSGPSCAYPPTTTACGSTCNNALLSRDACDGAGKCVAGAMMPCPGNLTCQDAMSCKTGCMADGDCAGGWVCGADHTCAAPAGANCDGDHTVKSPPPSANVDCSPYKCVGTSCRMSCTSLNDCVAPAVCDLTGHCIMPSGTAPAASSESSGGCAIAHARDPRGGALAASMAVLLAALRRRRARTLRRTLRPLVAVTAPPRSSSSRRSSPSRGPRRAASLAPSSRRRSGRRARRARSPGGARSRRRCWRRASRPIRRPRRRHACPRCG